MKCNIGPEELWPVASVTIQEPGEEDDPKFYCHDISVELYAEYARVRSAFLELSERIMEDAGVYLS